MKPYKMLVFSDMHGNLEVVDKAEKLISQKGFDAVVYLGDYSKRSNDSEANLTDAGYLIEKLSKKARVFSLFGNCDSHALRKFLEDMGVALHGKTVSAGGLSLAGWGGSHPTPFGTPSEFSEAEIEAGLKKVLGPAGQAHLGGPGKLVLFTHEPPARTNGDKLPFGHVGSESLRKIIEAYKPALNVCGHVHEAKSTDHIGETKVINVGPAGSGHFLGVYLDGGAEVEEIDV